LFKKKENKTNTSVKNTKTNKSTNIIDSNEKREKKDLTNPDKRFSVVHNVKRENIIDKLKVSTSEKRNSFLALLKKKMKPNRLKKRNQRINRL
jgi:hypothetical protein